MKNYIKYFIVLIIVIFSFYYSDKVIELSEQNNIILSSINDYASKHDKKCMEGYINDNGIVLGYSGLAVDKNKSYSNMKGIGFKEELIEYKTTKCILSKEDNFDKYIISSNKYKSNISLVIDVDNLKYYKEMNEIAVSENVELNFLVNKYQYKMLNINKNILYKTNKNDIKEFKKMAKNFYCVKYDAFDVIKYCSKEKINSINIINYVFDNLLCDMKKSLDKGNIYFIKENIKNTKELRATIKYIKSRGYNILSIDELLF